MPKSISHTPRERITALRDSGLKWREIGEEFKGVPLGTLCRIYKDQNYEPRKPEILRALGLPITVMVAVCSLHGIIHEKRCPGAEPKPRKPTKNARRKKLIHDERWRVCYHSFMRMKR